MSVQRLFEPGEASHVAAEQRAGHGPGRQGSMPDAAALGADREYARTSFTNPLRMFVPGEAADIAEAQAADPAPRAPRTRGSAVEADAGGAAGAMRLFAPGEASDVASTQAAAHPDDGAASAGSAPRLPREPLFGESNLLRSLRLFEPGEATDVAAAQAPVMPRRSVPRPGGKRVAGAGLEDAAPVGAWAYPSELGGPAGGAAAGTAVAGERAIVVAPVLTREPSVDPLLPDAHVQKKGPFSVSIVAHALVIALVIARTSWMAAHQETQAAPDPGVFVALQVPQPEPMPPKPPIQAPPAPKPEPHPPAPQPAPKAESTPIPPPASTVPVPLPPLPAPTRMGQPEPNPHLPIPGTVPPDAQAKPNKGQVGDQLPQQTPGAPTGTNDVDAGAGSSKGPGSPGSGDEPANDDGTIHQKFLGGLEIRSHRPPGRGREGAGGDEGGGARRGLDLHVSGTGLGDFTFEDQNYDWNDYYSQMHQLILHAWYKRLYMMTSNFERYAYLKGGRALRGTVLIRFVIERNGAVSAIEVLEPSVMGPLDESARGALKEVILPRLPADFPKEREGVTGRFIMEVDDVGEFKWELERWYAMNKDVN